MRRMKVRISEIKKHPVLERIYPRMSEKELKKLKESIKKNGLREPLKVTKDLVLVDGYNRLQAITSLGWKEVEIEYLEDQNLIDLMIASQIYNAERRHLTNFQRVYSYILIRQLATVKTSGGIPPPSLTNREIARRLGIDKKCVDKAMKIINSGRKDLINKVYHREITEEAALRELNKNKKTKVSSKGKKVVIYIPDDLWEEYHSKHPLTSYSEFCSKCEEVIKNWLKKGGGV